MTAACNSAEKETPNGFKYTVITKGEGSVAKPGQLLLVDFTFKDSKDFFPVTRNIFFEPNLFMISGNFFKLPLPICSSWFILGVS